MQQTTEPLIRAATSQVTTARRRVFLLQIVTVGWMLVELAASAIAAYRSHSVALLAFGSDSLVEVLSATVVLLQFRPGARLSRSRAARLCGILLYVLAGIVGLIAIGSMLQKSKTEKSILGIFITAGALIVMPILARLKRKLAAETNDRALAADAVQSATCAYLAFITLASLAIQMFFPLQWLDPIAAFCAIPILIVEGRRARRGEHCGCC
jgi:divalent metal cation (Fe/Co/Zn/Cd) transporter